MITYQTPLRPKRGARSTRVTPPRERDRQPVTNREWQEQRRRARANRFGPDIFEKLFGKLLELVT